jgi:2-polyprenyl-3-methyl-5-hydroxy-6-metoxy-1,4-benzoquinol methylase
MSNYSQNQLVDDPNHVWAKLLGLIPNAATVLDVGCSSGNFGRELQRLKDCVVDGVEPDEHDARTASQYLRQVWAFDIENASNLKQIKRTYDVILFADVLEHLVHPEATLKAMRKLLNPQGSIVFSLPNMAHISVRLSLLGGTFAYTEVGLLDKTHLHFYDLETVRTMFTAAGMHLTNLDSSSYAYPDYLIKRRLDALGLTPTKKGLKLLTAPDAAAFQYVGRAVFGNQESVALHPTTPAVAQDVQIMTQEIQSNRSTIDRLNKDVNNLQEHIQAISDQLQALTASQAYRLGNAIAKPVRLIKASVKKDSHGKK